MLKKILFVLGFISISLTLIGCSTTECETEECTTEYIVQDCTTVDTIITPDPDFDDDLIFEVMYMLESRHYTQPSRELLIEGAIAGMIDILDDPFTSYFDAERSESYDAGFGESYVGIGVVVQFLDDLVIIQSVVSGGPADTAGIRPNDIITEVDGISAIGKDFYEVIGTIIGEAGTEVVVGVVRNGVDEIIDFAIIRAVIDNPTVEVETFLRDDELIGYIKVNTFGAQTASLFSLAIEDLEQQGMDSLIVDLRVNGGGYLSAVLDMLRQFLVNDDKPMFSTQTYTDGVINQYDYYGYISSLKPYEVVTLVNGNSASASEVFASAMQEHGEYKVVGVTTYGKGTMQTDVSLTASIGDQVHLTIGKWFTSNHNWVHYDGGTDGVTPDIIQELNEYEKAYKVFLLNDEILLYDTVDDRVANIQLILSVMGYTVRTDGYYDTATQEAVKDIQTLNSLPATGNMDSDTLEIINNSLSTYQNDSLNDSQLEAAINYLLGNE